MLLTYRQFILTFVISSALLFSSVFVSVKASELNSSASNQPLISLTALGLLHPVECESHSQAETQTAQHCCASICLMKMPCGQSIKTHDGPLSSLALMRKDDNQKAITRIQTLFRPPIATS